MIDSFGQDEISYEENLMLDYRQIDAKHAAEYADYMQQFRTSDTKYRDNMADTLASFSQSSEPYSRCCGRWKSVYCIAAFVLSTWYRLRYFLWKKEIAVPGAGAQPNCRWE